MTFQGREIKTVAVDFDGTLFKSDNYPWIGEPIQETIDFVKGLKAMGCELILWTNREGSLLDDALAMCEKHGLEFDAVNENMQWRIDTYGDDCRKVGADLYIDDRALNPKDLWLTSLTHLGLGMIDNLTEEQQIIMDEIRDKIFAAAGLPRKYYYPCKEEEDAVR